jgi:dihydroflavonol-4-reductase
MTTLVAGATGFLGGHLTRALVQRGRRVRALVRPSSRVAPLIAQNVEIVTGFIENRADVLRAAEGVETIYNAAGAFRTFAQPDSYFFGVNARGVENILEAARQHGVARTIHTSTIGVHGDVPQIPCTEDSPLNPGDAYQRSKAEGDIRAREAFRRTDPPGVVVRPASMYGPGDLRFLKLFRSVQRGTFCLFGDGRTLFHGIYIDDLVDAMLLCGEHPEAVRSEVFILAGPRWVTLSELVTLVAQAVGAPPPRWRLPIGPLLAASRACELLCRPLGIEPPLHPRRAHFFINNRAFSTDKARRLLGFVPRVDMPEGIARTALWYVRQGLIRPTDAPERMLAELERRDHGPADAAAPQAAPSAA